MTRLLLVVPALIAVVVLAGTVGTPDFAAADEPAAASDTLVVNGEGSVEAAPDEASFSFGVETRGATAKAALSENGAELRKVIAALRDAGARDLATQYVSVWPVSENGSINGYTASNSVSATIAVDRAGELIDAATAAGANNLSGPSMSQTDAERVYRRALAAAIADARARAEALAKAAGRTLGGIAKISEGTEQAIPYYDRAALTAEAATPIVPGKQKTSATISVTFDLR
jgi:uncharacterized protein YggE